MGVRIVFRQDEAQEGGGYGAKPTDAIAAGTLLVPEEVLVEQDGATGVFVLERDAVRFVEVSIGKRRSGRAAVESGLRAGQTLILDPPPSLKDGDRVRITQG